MTRDEIIATIRSAAPALKAEGVTRLAIFGSRARGDARSDSDLDVLVEVEPDSRFSALNLVGVQHIIRDATGIEVQSHPCADRSNRAWRSALPTTSSRCSEVPPSPLSRPGEDTPLHPPLRSAATRGRGTMRSGLPRSMVEGALGLKACPPPFE